MTRRRSRRRAPRSRLVPLAVCAVLVCAPLVWGGGLASTAFTTASVPRGASADVTIDEEGAHSLDVAAAVHVGATDPLVNVTNNLATDVTVTVSLDEGSTHLGDLVVDGVTEGNATTFALSAGDTQTVELDVPDDSSLSGETVYFDANATATGLEANASDRSVPVE